MVARGAPPVNVGSPRDRGLRSLEVSAEAEAAWNAMVQSGMPGTVWAEGNCASWYLDARGRNTTLWPDFTFRFRRALKRFDAESYAGRAASDSASAPTGLALVP